MESPEHWSAEDAFAFYERHLHEVEQCTSVPFDRILSQADFTKLWDMMSSADRTLFVREFSVSFQARLDESMPRSIATVQRIRQGQIDPQVAGKLKRLRRH